MIERQSPRTGELRGDILQQLRSIPLEGWSSNVLKDVVKNPERYGFTQRDAFWISKAEKGSEPIDPYTLIMAEHLANPDIEMIPRNDMVSINVDVQGAFEKEGGLPLDLATKEFRKLHTPNPDIATVDCHTENNIANAEAHGHPDFSYIFLNENDQVMIQIGGEVKPYTAKEKSIHTVDSVKEYLKKQRTTRKLTALLLNTEVSGVGQVLWPLHANNLDDEMRNTQEHDITPQVVIKGVDDREDSYSGLVSAAGSAVMTDNESTAEIITKKLETKKLDTLVFNGYATNYCVLFSAESARLAQEIQKIVNAGESEINWRSIIQEKIRERKNIAVSEEELTMMIDIITRLVKNKMLLDPNIKICVALNEGDVVRGPAGIQTTEDVQNLIENYQAMGVKIVRIDNK